MDIGLRIKWLCKDKLQISLSDRKWFYLIYTILFSIFFVICFGLFSIYGKAPVWSADGISQHFPGVIYLKNWLKEGWDNLISGYGINFKQWDSTIGFGENVLNVVSFRPIAWLSIFFNEEHLTSYLWFAIALRMYLTGITFCEYSFYMRFNHYATLMSGLLYTFSSYAMINAPRHFLFINMMFLLPLICLGIEKIFREEKQFVFIFGVAAAAWSYFYMFYILMVYAVIYFFIHFFFDEGEKNIRKFITSALQCTFGGILGLFMAMVSVLPMMLLAFQSDRVGGFAEKTYTYSWHYIRTFYVDCLLHLFDCNNFYLGFVLGISGLSGIAVLFMIFSNKKSGGKYTKYLVAFIVITFLLAVPFGNSLFNAFSGSTFRWCFGYHFLLCTILVAVFPDMINLSKQILFKIVFVVVLYVLILLVLFLLGETINITGVFSLFIFTIWLFSMELWGKKVIGVTSKLLLLSLVALEIILKSTGLYSPYGENYLDEFYDIDTVNSEVDNLAAVVVKQLQDSSLYRVDEIDSNFYESVYNRNYGLRGNINGVSSFYSYSDGGIRAYSEGVGLAQQPAPFCILNLTHRTVLNTLNAVKYIAVPEMVNNVFPYGYELLETVGLPDEYSDIQNIRIYKNQYCLPYMYCYDSYIAEQDYLKLSTTQKEQAMLQGIVLEDEINYPKTNLEFNEKTILTSDEILTQLKDKSANSTSIIVGDSWIQTLSNNASITIDFEGIENSESYIKWDNLEFIPTARSTYSDVVLGKNATKMEKLNYELPDMIWDIESTSRITIDNAQSIYLADEFDQYYKGSINAVGNLGYEEIPKNQVHLTFSGIGIYKFSDMQISSQPMDHYADRVNKLMTNPVENIQLVKDGIRGNVELKEKHLVYINIPYNIGWTAYINGKQVEIYRANQMYMAIMAEAGENEILLIYDIPGLKWGKIISFSSIGMYILFYLSRHLTRSILTKKVKLRRTRRRLSVDRRFRIKKKR